MDAAYTYDATVIRVIDGDTLDVLIDVGFRMSATMPLRLAHIDAPERFTAPGKDATAFVTVQLASVKNAVVVRTYKPTDKYGRYLADVFIGEDSLADLLVGAGLAVPYEGGTRKRSSQRPF